MGEMGGKVDVEGVVSGAGMWVVWSPLVRAGVGAGSVMLVCWNSCACGVVVMADVEIESGCRMCCCGIIDVVPNVFEFELPDGACYEFSTNMV